MKTTEMNVKELRNQLNAMQTHTNTLIIPTTTGEYTLTTNLTDIPYREEPNQETHNSDQYDNPTIIAYITIPIEQANQVLQTNLNNLPDFLNVCFTDGNYFTDDDYYDYIPDYIHQIQLLGTALDKQQSTHEALLKILKPYLDSHDYDGTWDLTIAPHNPNNEYYDLSLLCKIRTYLNI